MPSPAAPAGHDRRPSPFLGDDYAFDDSDEETVDDVFDGDEVVGDSHVRAAGQVANSLPNLNGGAGPPVAASTDSGCATPRCKRPRAEARATPGSSATTEARGKPPAAAEDSRRLFQRLWTDEDEIVILRGFLDYNRGHHRHQDTGPFYDQIRACLQLDFNKNQLVEKLRRLKKKYRNVTARMSSGRDYTFKSSHDQATFDLSRQIWGSSIYSRGGGGGDDDDLDLTPHPIVVRGEVTAHPPDLRKERRRGRKRSVVEVVPAEQAEPAEASLILMPEAPVKVKVAESHLSAAIAPVNVKVAEGHVPAAPSKVKVAESHTPAAMPPVKLKVVESHMPVALTPVEVKVPESHMPTALAPVGVKVADNHTPAAPAPALVELKVVESHTPAAMASVPNVVQETVRSCLSPMFKELLCCAVGGRAGSGELDGIRSSLLPLSFGCNQVNNLLQSSAAAVDEKWRKQHILELEVFSKRLELVQEQIKSMLRELRSTKG